MVQVSIIVPIYNLEKKLDACLSSLAAQTYSQLQILLIDDGSQDHSLAICREWEKKDSRFEVYHHSNRGVSYTRNVGLTYAQGFYVMFVDGDDIVNIDMVEQYVSLAESWQAELVVGGIEVHRQDGTVIKKAPAVEGLQERKDFLKLLCADNDTAIYGYIPNKIYRKSLLEKNHIRFCEHMVAQEDLHFALQAYEKAHAIGCISYAGYQYCYVPNKRTVPTSDLIGNQMYILKLAKANNIGQHHIQLQIQRIQEMIYTCVYWAKNTTAIQEIAQIPGVNTVVQEETKLPPIVNWCITQMRHKNYKVLWIYFLIRRCTSKFLHRSR